MSNQDAPLLSPSIMVTVKSRVASDIEPPETARQLLTHGKYAVTAAVDIWAFGQLMLKLSGSCQPAAHCHITLHDEYNEELQRGGGETPGTPAAPDR